MTQENFPPAVNCWPNPSVPDERRPPKLLLTAAISVSGDVMTDLSKLST